jgi:hypothetical protein
VPIRQTTPWFRTTLGCSTQPRGIKNVQPQKIGAAIPLSGEVIIIPLGQHPRKTVINGCVAGEEEVGMGKTLFSLTFATVLLALASSEASAFVCQAVGVRSVAWGRSFFVADGKLIALSRCARRSGICTISYCIPEY